MEQRLSYIIKVKDEDVSFGRSFEDDRVVNIKHLNPSTSSDSSIAIVRQAWP